MPFRVPLRIGQTNPKRGAELSGSVLLESLICSDDDQLERYLRLPAIFRAVSNLLRPLTDHSPAKVPDLTSIYGRLVEERYERREDHPSHLKQKRRKQIQSE